MDKSASNKIRNMGFVCALLVVSIHTGLERVDGSAHWWLRSLFDCGVARIAVPFFFIASGFFIAGKPWHVEVRKRIKSLVVPYLIFALAYAAWLWLVTASVNAANGNNLLLGLPDKVCSLTWILGLKCYALPALGPLWYVRNLLLLVLIYPLIEIAVKGKGRGLAWLLAVFSVYVAIAPSPPPHGPNQKFLIYLFSLEGLFYFSAGMYLRMNSFALRIRREVAIPCIFAGFTLLALQVYFNVEEYRLRTVAIPFLIVGVFGLVPGKEWPILLTSLSFPIYLIHKFVIFPFEHHHGFWLSFGNPCFGQIAFYCSIVLLSMAAALMFKRFSPKISAICFGGGATRYLCRVKGF